MLDNLTTLKNIYNRMIYEEANPELTTIVEAEQFIEKYKELKEQGFTIVDKLKQIKNEKTNFSDKASELLDQIAELNFQ